MKGYAQKVVNRNLRDTEMGIKKERLQLELIELTEIAMNTQHTILSGILLATVIDYLSNIDRHKHTNIPLSCMKTTKKELISFVDEYFRDYICELNDWLYATGSKKKYGFDNFTSEDFVEMFYRVKHSFSPHVDRGFEFTFYGTIAGHAKLLRSGQRKQFCLNPGILANNIVDVIDWYFGDCQPRAAKTAIDRFCSSYESPYPISYL